MRFLLDNDVDHDVANLLRGAGHSVVTASEVGLAGAVAAADDEVTVYATDRRMIVVTHDREFTARRKRNTIGLHIRLMCAQPDAVDVVRERYDELLDALSWTDTAVAQGAALAGTPAVRSFANAAHPSAALVAAISLSRTGE